MARRRDRVQREKLFVEGSAMNFYRTMVRAEISVLRKLMDIRNGTALSQGRRSRYTETLPKVNDAR